MALNPSNNSNLEQLALKGLNKSVSIECLKQSNDIDGSLSSDVRQFQVADHDE